MAEVREYSYGELDEKVLNPTRNPTGVVRHSAQLKASERLRIYRDMAFPETLVAEGAGTTVEYAWALVVSARRLVGKVVPIGDGEQATARSSNPQAQGQRR
jgi:hypothetical protein